MYIYIYILFIYLYIFIIYIYRERVLRNDTSLAQVQRVLKSHRSKMCIIYICYHENNVPSGLPPQKLCVSCRNHKNCVSWITDDYLYYALCLAC